MDKSLRITAEQHKLLFELEYVKSCPVPQELREREEQAVKAYCAAINDQLAPRLLQAYDENADSNKRIHVLPLRAYLQSTYKEIDENLLLMICFSVYRGGKCLFENSRLYCFSKRYCCFVENCESPH